MLSTYSSKSITNLLSISALILANIIPLLGVLFQGWNASTILFLYWAESIPIGIFALLRIGMAGQPNGSPVRFISRIPLLLFFPIHFGIFMLGHYIFLTLFMGAPDLSQQEIAMILTSLFLSHGSSFGVNYLAGGEYRVTTPDAEMARPYGRIMVMHVTLIVGGMAAMAFEEPTLMLVLLVLLKTGIDLYSHIRNHSRYNTNAQRPIGGVLERPESLSL